jgi:hypothetical protein
MRNINMSKKVQISDRQPEAPKWIDLLAALEQFTDRVMPNPEDPLIGPIVAPLEEYVLIAKLTMETIARSIPDQIQVYSWRNPELIIGQSSDSADSTAELVESRSIPDRKNRVKTDGRAFKRFVWKLYELIDEAWKNFDNLEWFIDFFFTPSRREVDIDSKSDLIEAHAKISKLSASLRIARKRSRKRSRRHRGKIPKKK